MLTCRPILLGLMDRVYPEVDDWLTNGHDAYVYLTPSDQLVAIRDDDAERIGKSQDFELVAFVSGRMGSIDGDFVSASFGRA